MAGGSSRSGGDEAARGARETVDARGGLVLPGFDDAHIHLLSGAREANGALLYPLETVAEIQDRIRAHAAAHPEHPWVLGRGWLTRRSRARCRRPRSSTRVVPDQPAWMSCFDGHTSWANTAAMQLAGITRDTPDPPAGVIVRDADGNATGAFKEEAQALIDRIVPLPSEADDTGLDPAGPRQDSTPAGSPPRRTRGSSQRSSPRGSGCTPTGSSTSASAVR